MRHHTFICGHSKRPYFAKGKCRQCYKRDESATRNRTSKMRAYKQKWHQQKTREPGFAAVHAEYERKWRSTSERAISWKFRKNLRESMRHAARSQFFGIGRPLKGVAYICPVHPRHTITSPITEKELRKDIFAFEIFKKEMLELCTTKSLLNISTSPAEMGN